MTLKTTPLNSSHRQLKARMVDFAGWEMPIQYAGPLPEHMAVREAVGIFDISHMGEIEVTGTNATEVVQHVTCNDVTSLVKRQAQYSALLTEQGTFVDDIVVYKFSDMRYLLCVNAANSDRAFAWIQSQSPEGAEIHNRSDDFVQLALQGPNSPALLQEIASVDLSDLAFYHFCIGEVAGHEAIISRTGYTGEKGFEIYASPQAGPPIWATLLDIGSGYDLQPAGLAARNTLRLEMKYALYGNDIDDTTTPLEAGLGWIVKLDQGPFLGREALLRQKEDGIHRRLIGFELKGRGIPRDGYPIRLGDGAAATVSSGSYSPSLGKGIGMAYLPIEHTAIGTPIQIQIRSNAVDAQVVETPFYKGNRTSS